MVLSYSTPRLHFAQKLVRVSPKTSLMFLAEPGDDPTPTFKFRAFRRSEIRLERKLRCAWVWLLIANNSVEEVTRERMEFMNAAHRPTEWGPRNAKPKANVLSV